MVSLENLSWLLPPSNNAIKALKNRQLTSESIVELSSCKLDDSHTRLLAKLLLSKTLDDPVIAHLKPLKLAILTDCNLNFCVDTLLTAGLRYGLLFDVIIFEYSDILSQVSNPNSELFKFEPAFVFYANFASLLSSIVVSFDENNASQAVNQLLRELDIVIDSVAMHSNAEVLLQTVPSNQPDVFGNIDRFTANSLGYETERLNKELSERGRHIVDIARLASRVGVYRWFDDGKYHWTKVPFSLDYVAVYCDVVARRLASSQGNSKKCLVLDLDNTLWGGVIGDDGLGGIFLGNNSPSGETFLAGQRYYKMLANRGVLLAVCSKNDMENALLPFEQHPDMILEKQDISCFVANWQDKPGNIKYISEALNLGLDSFVFLDDNPMERDFVRQCLPQVAVPEVPNKDASQYPRILEAAGYFESISFTSADLKRAKDYYANAKREVVREQKTDLDEYLKELEMRLCFEAMSSVDEDRIVQLVNRSNQFNLTTRRYTNTQIAAIYNAKNRFGFTVRLQDKFSDSGLIAIIICDVLKGNVWEIDTWLMSCRVLGRKVEEGVLLCLAKIAQDRNITTLVGRYIPTKKNKMVENHYLNLGFVPASDALQLTLFSNVKENVWQLDVANFMASRTSREPLPFKYD